MKGMFEEYIEAVDEKWKDGFIRLMEVMMPIYQKALRKICNTE